VIAEALPSASGYFYQNKGEKSPINKPQEPFSPEIGVSVENSSLLLNTTPHS